MDALNAPRRNELVAKKKEDILETMDEALILYGRYERLHKSLEKLPVGFAGIQYQQNRLDSIREVEEQMLEVGGLIGKIAVLLDCVDLR